MRRIKLFVALSLALGILLVTRTRLIYAADQVVNNCSNDDELRADLTAMQSGSGGTLTFNCGTATITLDALAALPAITKNTTIDGADKITLSGGNSTRVFRVNSGGILTLSHITVSNGNADSDGGGVGSFDGGAIYASPGSVLNIASSKFLNNVTTKGNGGAVSSSTATLSIVNSEFAGNKGLNGGAIYTTGVGAVAIVSGSNLYLNEATANLPYGWGGALYGSEGTDVTVHSSAFSQNAADYGGAIMVYQNQHNTKLTLDTSTLDANGAGYGGGIYVTRGTVILTNATFDKNAANAQGGGIYIYKTTNASFTNLTFVGNDAYTGGGIAMYDSVLFLKNSALVHASGENCAWVGPAGITGYNPSYSLSDDANCAFGAGRDNRIDMKLGPLADNGGLTKTHLPQAGSSAIDGGTNDGCPSTDQRGFSRPQGSSCDVGSVEVLPPAPTATATRTATATYTPTIGPSPTPTNTPVGGCQTKPAKPQLKSPANNGTVNTTTPTLKWKAALCAQTYQVTIRKAATGKKVDGTSNLTATKYKTNALPKNMQLEWSVKACNGTYGCAQSVARVFTVQ